MLARSIEPGGRALVAALDPEDLLGAAVVALALEGTAEAVTLAWVGAATPWVAPLGEWWAAQAVPVEVAPFASTDGFDHVYAVASGFGRGVPGALATHPRARFVLVAAGARAAELAATRARFLERAADGELVDVAPIPRYGRVGRALIELIEHVHHAVGPGGQSRVADTLRAALFGRAGRVPVNLACRDDPPELDPLTILVAVFEPVDR